MHVIISPYLKCSANLTNPITDKKNVLNSVILCKNNLSDQVYFSTFQIIISKKYAHGWCFFMFNTGTGSVHPYLDRKLLWPHVGPTWIMSAPRSANVETTCLVIWVPDQAMVPIVVKQPERICVQWLHEYITSWHNYNKTKHENVHFAYHFDMMRDLRQLIYRSPGFAVLGWECLEIFGLV